MMVDKLWLAVCAVVILISVTEQSSWFDCRRDGESCNNHGVCDLTSGDCACNDATIVGFDCRGTPANEGQSIDTCDPRCSSSTSVGCYNLDNGQGLQYQCYCNTKTTGETCDTPRGRVTCDGSKMYVELDLHSQPDMLFVPGYITTDPCFKALNSTNATFELSIETGCGAGVNGTTNLTDTPAAGDVTYKNWLVVRYLQGVESSLDSLFELTCVIGEGTYNVTGTIEEINVDHNVDMQPIVLDDATLDIFDLRLLRNAALITAPIRVGQAITLEIGLKSTDIYQQAQFDSCVMSATPNDTGRSIPIISQGCAVETSEGGYIVRGAVTRMGEKQSLDLAAAKFDGQVAVYFICAVRICKTQCVDATCGGGGGAVRKRRAVSENDGEMETIVARIEVEDRFDNTLPESPPTVKSPPAPVVEKTEDCRLSVVITTALAVFGTGVLLLAVTSLILIVKYLRLKKKSQIEGKVNDGSRASISSRY